MKKVTKKSVKTENKMPVLLAVFGLFVLLLLALVWKQSLDNRSDAAGNIARPVRCPDGYRASATTKGVECVPNNSTRKIETSTSGSTKNKVVPTTTSARKGTISR